jgi:calcineurin-like phosphoesterase family protein
MAIHFVADLHFNDNDARRAHLHGFSDNAEMTRRICDVWRARVAPGDAVWILGNVGNSVHLADLPGTKHLVRGALDQPAWNCLGSRRYASVCDFHRLETPHGAFFLTGDPSTAPFDDVTVLHGRARGTWDRSGYVCVSADRTGWGPVSLDEIVHGSIALREAA